MRQNDAKYGERDLTRALTGIGFSVLFVVGFAAMGNVPDNTGPASKIDAFYASSTKRTEAILQSFVVILAGLSFIWMLSRLYGTLRTALDGESSLPLLAFASGLAFVVIALVGEVISVAGVYDMTFGQAAQPRADVLGILPQVGYSLVLVAGAACALVFTLATALAVLRTAVFPRWVGWTGLVTAVILLGSPMFMPILVFPLWILAMSIAAALRPSYAGAEQVALST